jgi:hypothetical protein
MRASHVNVSVALSPLDCVKFPKDPVNFRFFVAAVEKQPGAFDSLCDFRLRRFGVALFLAGADGRLFILVSRSGGCHGAMVCHGVSAVLEKPPFPYMGQTP